MRKRRGRVERKVLGSTSVNVGSPSLLPDKVAIVSKVRSTNTLFK